MDAEFKEIEKTILPWLGKTNKIVELFTTDKLVSHGLSLTKAQFIVLRMLYVNDGLSQHELAFVTDRDKTSLTRLVATMERKKLIKRKVDEHDKRINRVFITEQGKDNLRSALPALHEVIETVQKGIDEEELKVAISVLNKIRDNIDISQLSADK